VRRSVVIAMAVAWCAAWVGPVATAAPVARPTRYVVTLRPSATDPDTFVVRVADRFRFPVRHVDHAALRGFAADLPPAALIALAADPDVVGVTPDAPLAATAQVIPAGIRRIHGDPARSAAPGDSSTPTPPDSAAAAGIEVADLRVGGSRSDDGHCGQVDGDVLHQAICRSVAAGTTDVAAAGNDHADASTTIPAAYPEVITVSALVDSDGRAGGGGGPPSCRPNEQDDTLASFRTTDGPWRSPPPACASCPPCRPTATTAATATATES
jgi:hypothetical protein